MIIVCPPCWYSSQIECTVPGGCVVVVANQHGDTTKLPLQLAARREIDIRGVYRVRAARYHVGEGTTTPEPPPLAVTHCTASGCVGVLYLHGGPLQYRNTFHTARALVARGVVRVAPLISHRFPLQRANDAFRQLAAGEAGKVLILPNTSKAAVSDGRHTPNHERGADGAQLTACWRGSAPAVAILPTATNSGSQCTACGRLSRADSTAAASGHASTSAAEVAATNADTPPSLTPHTHAAAPAHVSPARSKL